MARAVRTAQLETRTARARLPKQERHFIRIGDNVSMEYRRPAEGSGTWMVRVRDAKTGKERYEKLGVADDHLDADPALKGAPLTSCPDSTVLTYFQAAEKARYIAQLPASANVTVREACKAYLEWFKEERKSFDATQAAVDAHILPQLADIRLSDLTERRLREWHSAVAAAPARVRTKKFAAKAAHRAAAKTNDEKRARRATANRILTILRAVLNQAAPERFMDWRQVKPFKKVDEPRIRFLTDDEAYRLVNACPADLRALVKAALLTGARFGELMALTVRDITINTEAARVYIAESKSGKPRHVPLNPEGRELFKALILGKTGEQPLFRKADGSAWGKNHHVRPLAEACAAAKVKPAVSFHELRHTYASHLAQAGVDLLTISKLLGHADTRITAKHYAHLADKTLAAAVTKLPSFTSDPRANLQPVSAGAPADEVKTAA